MPYPTRVTTPRWCTIEFGASGSDLGMISVAETCISHCISMTYEIFDQGREVVTLGEFALPGYSTRSLAARVRVRAVVGALRFLSKLERMMKGIRSGSTPNSKPLSMANFRHPKSFARRFRKGFSDLLRRTVFGSFLISCRYSSTIDRSR